MNKWNEILKRNQELDNAFNEKYNYDTNMYEKNCIELLTELGELANETKCFKYWTIKEPDKLKILEEYADCITMSLYFIGYMNSNLENLPNKHQTKDINELFNYLFNKSSLLYNNKDEKIVKDIFVNILHLRDYLNITEKELQESCINKQNIVFERLKSNY